MIKKELRGKATMVLCAVLAVSVCAMPVSAKSKKVRISRTSLTMEKGAKIRLKIKNAKKGIKVIWKSSNKKVAAVSKKGLVRAKKSGKAKITAKLGKKSYKCSVRVISNKKVHLYNNVVTVADSQGNNQNNIDNKHTGDNSINMDDLLNPSSTKKPKSTDNPKTTAKPKVTEKPKATDKPKATRAPKPTPTRRPATNVDPGIADAPVMNPSTRDDGWIPGWY